jgi:hypothetical protein
MCVSTHIMNFFKFVCKLEFPAKIQPNVRANCIFSLAHTLIKNMQGNTETIICIRISGDFQNPRVSLNLENIFYVFMFGHSWYREYIHTLHTHSLKACLNFI